MISFIPLQWSVNTILIKRMWILHSIITKQCVVFCQITVLIKTTLLICSGENTYFLPRGKGDLYRG